MQRLTSLILLLLTSQVFGCQAQQATPSTYMGSSPKLVPEDNQRNPSSGLASPDEQETVIYRVEQQFTVANLGPGNPSKHDLWLALIADHPPYQKVLSRDISASKYTLTGDEYGNQYAEFDLSEVTSGSETTINVTYNIEITRLSFDLGECQGSLPDFYTTPELHIESNNIQILELSENLLEGSATACQQVEAFYNYTGNNLVYSYNGNNWGAQAALGKMGADCTEYSSLMIALSRAAGIPARYVEGLVYLSEESDALARTEHAWLDVYLPGVGWTPMDPTMGRSSIHRGKYFGQLPPDHIIVTRGRNPSTLRGSSYWTHLYWPGNSSDIQIQDFQWNITKIEELEQKSDPE